MNNAYRSIIASYLKVVWRSRQDSLFSHVISLVVDGGRLFSFSGAYLPLLYVSSTIVEQIKGRHWIKEGGRETRSTVGK